MMRRLYGERATEGGFSIWLAAAAAGAIGIFTLALAACSSAYAQEQQAVNRVVQTIIEADSAGDLETVVSLYADDAILLAPGAKDIEGITEIRAHYSRLFAETELEIESRILETAVSGSWAMVRGTNRVVATTRASATSLESADKYIMILNRDSAGAWKISRLIWAEDAP